MTPTSKELIQAIIAAIDTTVLPQVEEKQAASSLRAMRTLLEHLAVRVEIEPDVLAADNKDAEDTLRRVGRALPAASTSSSASLVNLNNHNNALQALVDSELLTLPAVGSETAEQATTRRELRGYLARRHGREREMVFPAFLGAPF
jgi:hypothetical protein